MSNDQITTHEHYIPQCYIENWYNENNKVWAYNTKYKKSKQYASAAICYIDNLYEGNFETNLIENNLSKTIEPSLSKLLDKIINHEELNDIEYSSIIYHAISLLMRSPYLVNNLPDSLNIDKDTYILGALPFYLDNKVMMSLYNTYKKKYIYCIELKSKFFVFNDVTPVLLRNPKVDSDLDTFDENSNIYFPITSNMCLIITNEYQGDDFYIKVVARYIDWINELFINSKCNYIYSTNNIDNYIKQHTIN